MHVLLIGKMFQKVGVASSSSSKDAPLKKSEKRKLRETLIRNIFPTLLDLLGADYCRSGSASNSNDDREALMMILNDALSFKQQSGGDILVRKVKLQQQQQQYMAEKGSGSAKSGCVLLYLRIPPSSSTTTTTATEPDNLHDCWPYRYTTQPILLELEHEFIKPKNADLPTLIPCLPLLSAIPHSCLPFPRVLVYSQVSTFLCRGANLMRSGVESILPSPLYSGSSGNTCTNRFKTAIYPRGTIVTVHVVDNPTPMAVGVLVAAYPTEMRVGVGAKGICVDIITCFGDDLWNISKEESTRKRKTILGSKWEQRPNYGNDGFIDGKVVLPLSLNANTNDLVEAAISSSMSPVPSPSTDEQRGHHVSDIHKEAEFQKNEQTIMFPQKKTNEESNNMTIIELDDRKREASVLKDRGADKICTPVANDVETVSAATSADTIGKNDFKIPDNSDQDALLLYSFHRALVTTVTDKVLPLPISTLYASHILPARPPNTNLDLKQTKVKKIGIFLMGQIEDGIVQAKSSSDGREAVAFLTKVNRSHPTIRKMKHMVQELCGTTDDTLSHSQKVKKLTIVDLFKIPPYIVSTLDLNVDDVSAATASSDVRRGSGFLTGKEVKEILNDYIAREQLVEEDQPSNIRMNGPLADVLFKVSKKHQQQKQTSQDASLPLVNVSRKKVLDLWVSKLDPAYALVAMPGSEVISLKKGAPRKVEIEVETRQGNKKFVTRIRGLEEVRIAFSNFSKNQF
jgi:predicted ribosome-associated RNA-binding protein Tma20